MIQEILDAQNRGELLRVVVRSRKERDLLVSRGVKPSNICMTSDLKPKCDWQKAHVGLFDDVNRLSLKEE